MSIHGSCVCGAVRYAITGEVGSFVHCHCSRCRKSSGAAHGSSLFVKADQMTFTEGEQQVRRFKLDGTAWWCSAFCDTCGSALPWLTKNGKSWLVPAGGLDHDPGARPRSHIFVGSKAPWHDLDADLPRYPTYPD